MKARPSQIAWAQSEACREHLARVISKNRGRKIPFDSIRRRVRRQAEIRAQRRSKEL